MLEAQREVAAHQSGHNSGVLHSGIYYRPGSLKAVACRQGKAAMEAFCREESVPFERCGKVIVATTEPEIGALETIQRRGIENGIACQWIHSDQLRQLEPAAAGVAALHVPEAGIVDYREVCLAMRRVIEREGGKVLTDARVCRVDVSSGSVRLTYSTSRGDRGIVESPQVISCAGLQSDRILQLCGGTPSARIVPFRGEYYELIEAKRSLCRNLIYPVPDPSFPFLGVHFTRMIGGGVECGPNAVLALAREGYRWRDISARDLAETLKFGGFRKLARRHWRMGAGEIWRSVSKSAFVNALRKLIPAIRAEDLTRARSGVRAQAVAADGSMIDDFWIESTDRVIHVLNAPSPAATASLAIADRIVAMQAAGTSRAGH